VSPVAFLIFLVVVGIAWHFLKPYVAPPFDKIIMVVVILFFCLWLLALFGIVDPPQGMRVGRG